MLATLCVIKQEKYSLQQVNLLFHQFPQDHLHPSQLLLHLLTWASQKRVTPARTARCRLPSGQRDSPGSAREAPSPPRPWEPTSLPPWATVASGPSGSTACLVSPLCCTTGVERRRKAPQCVENILRDSTGQWKLCGSSSSCWCFSPSLGQSPGTCEPEMVQRARTESSDPELGANNFCLLTGAVSRPDCWLPLSRFLSCFPLDFTVSADAPRDTELWMLGFALISS